MIKENILKAEQRIRAACSRAGRDFSAVTIVAVSKGRPPEEISAALAAGITDIGENRVQEAALKYKKLITYNSELITIKWHMVGHLQTNKVKDAVKIFDLIHSLDSVRLAEEIDKQAARLNKIQDVLMEVKTSPEAAKSGIKPDQAARVIKEISGLKNIRMRGLMTIAPAVSNPEDARPYFRMLREAKDRINNLRLMTYDLQLLSMGMSDDFAVAVEEGATMVRLGRAIFGG